MDFKGFGGKKLAPFLGGFGGNLVESLVVERGEGMCWVGAKIEVEWW